MGDLIEVRYAGESNRQKIYRIIEQWCLENNISAKCDTRYYMTQRDDSKCSTTTWWNVADEKERMFFILVWGK